MGKYTEEDLRNAIQDVYGGMSGRQAAKKWEVPQSTLQDAQERHLCGWILIQDAAGNPPTHNQVRRMAARVLENNSDLEPLGKNWLDGFLARHKEEFFKILEIPAIKKILPQNRYNMDETGLAIGLRENGLVLGSSAKKVAMKKQSGQRFWSTIIECISATGKLIDPVVIFQGKSVQQQ
ncbi:hypothetical protein NLG97_g6588 [Lecanicillium saksenae]|uniref:Uncharacterized protein n=1 Tax=Lecanicillium saksenae TaxID=468837 RepID=A0ACC1QSB1_9HYPO|nr:hypothetical protein NLG97_g6588 [Lecanicillium saksenae]